MIYNMDLCMTKTFAIEELYKVSGKIDHTFDGFCITIDNFYENVEGLYDHLMGRQYPMWKYNSERNTPNGVEYNDCRIVDKIGHPTRLHDNDMKRVESICQKYFHKGHYNYNDLLEFNCFQTITQTDTKLQHYPHVDSSFDTSDELSTLNMLVYMDKEEDGGTAVYGGNWITNDEHQSLLYPVEDTFDLETIIPHKFNRCVIFPGNKLHGAWINDYTKYMGDKWRFTQVKFLHPTR